MPKIDDIEQLVNNIMRCNTHAVQVGEGLVDIPYNGRVYRVVVLDAEGLVSFEVYRSAPGAEDDISEEEAARIARAQALADVQGLARGVVNDFGEALDKLSTYDKEQEEADDLSFDADMVEAGFASALDKLPTYDKEQADKATDDRGVDSHDVGGEG